jgi:hypothetical protein
MRVALSLCQPPRTGPTARRPMRTGLTQPSEGSPCPRPGPQDTTARSVASRVDRGESFRSSDG